jgi:hypothetical protein
MKLYVHEFGFSKGVSCLTYMTTAVTTGHKVHPLIILHVSLTVTINDALLSRLAIVPFTRLFNWEGNLEYTGCDSTEHLYFTCCDRNRQWQTMPHLCAELCGMVSSRMSLPGSRISATIFIIKFKALTTLHIKKC